MIVRPQSAPMRHLITAYDFEWRNEGGKLVIVLCGAYDERGYRWYQTIEQFVTGELVPGNAGRRYYAHFGGASDMVFLLKAFMADKSLAIRGLFSGSSAIVVSVDKRSNRWTFLDSFWTMRTSLASIGEWKGLPKLKFDHTREHSLAEWKEYNERDCKLLYEALTEFQITINDRGGELRVTGASTALDLFMRRYLKRPIKNGRQIDDYCREAYIASRVEKFRDYCGRANVWDINSSFPYSMTGPIAGDCLGMRTSLPDPTRFLWVADCDVRVPEQYIPPLPLRHPTEGRIFFPTGRFRTRLTSEDMLCGDFEIERVHSCMMLESRDDMAEFAEELFKLRSGGGFASQVWKIVLNSLYGKLAEKEEKEVLLVNPEKRPDPMTSTAIAPHIFLVKETAMIEHSHVAAPCIITARSRRLIREGAQAAIGERVGRYKPRPGPWAGDGRLYYTDTDSLVCDAWFEEGKALGDIKREGGWEKGIFIGSKLYAGELDEETFQAKAKKDPEARRVLTKAKGFSRIVSEGGEREPLGWDEVCKLKDGFSATVERMRRIRELLRESGGEYTPDVVRQQKQLRSPRPKRCGGLSGGDSRPWTIEELMP